MAIVDDIRLVATRPGEAMKRLRTARNRAIWYDIMERVFFQQAYYGIIKNLRPATTVIVIGASIGDTPIYFAQFDKVSKVIAFEPDPARFEEAMRNIELSPFRHKIKLSRDIIGNRGEQVFGTYSDALKRAVDNGSRIIHINDALKGKKNVVIQCNVAIDVPGKSGGEQQMFDKSADMRNVYQVEIVHYAPQGKLVEVLKSKGFAILSDQDLDGKSRLLHAIRNKSRL